MDKFSERLPRECLATSAALILGISLLAYFPAPVFGEEGVLEFEGTPRIKAVVSGAAVSSVELSSDEALKYRVEIVRRGGDYFWKSREDLPMHKKSSGAFITYIALSGAGYVRIVNPELRPSLCTADRSIFDCTFMYVERLTLGLNSIIYYGN